MPPCRSRNFYSKSWIIINDFDEQMCLSQRMCKVDLFVPQGICGYKAPLAPLIVNGIIPHTLCTFHSQQRTENWRVIELDVYFDNLYTVLVGSINNNQVMM